MLEKIERIPVPLLPTMVGAATLSNVYNGLGFSWVRHITMWAAIIVLLVYLVKIIKYPKTFLGEYTKTVPASLYAGMTMVMMITGSYLFDFAPGLGKGLWIAGLVLHGVHILVFTFQFVLKSRNADTFVPSWFVTYDGILVSCVVGGAMNAQGILKYVTGYGIIIYFILIPLLIWRLASREVKDPVYHTQAVVLAPCSLCIVAYLNVIAEPNAVLVWVLYACVIASLIFVLCKLPKFFSYSFTPAFAGLTFPMAIGIVASTKAAAFAASQGMEGMAEVITQISGIQIYVTSAIVAFVLFHFLRMLRKALQS